MDLELKDQRSRLGLGLIANYQYGMGSNSVSAF